MELSVATNFDDELIHKISKYPVKELYGKLPKDFVGGGRSTYMLSPLGTQKIKRHIQIARSHNIGFNYLLNAACLNNLETTKSGQRKIRKLLDRIVDFGATSTTVSNPLLLRMIKNHYPELKVRISVFAGIDHLRKAKFWEEQGADIICLDSLTVNRDLPALKSLRQNLSCDLELLANGNCLHSCSMSQTHMNLLAHSSQKNHRSKGFVIDHCILECSKRKLEKPVNFLRSDWIRPEDLHFYEEIGYHNFKLVERNLPTEVMVKRVKAYSEKQFKGNLIELIQPYGQVEGQKVNKLYPLSFLLRPLKVNLFKLKKIHQLTEKRGMLTPLKGEQPIHLDNALLDGFLQEVFQVDCRNMNCDQCQICHKFAKKALSIQKDFQSECLGLHQDIDQDIEKGTLW